MELNKCDFLASLGLNHIQHSNGIRQVPSPHLTKSPTKLKKVKNKRFKGKFKFNSFVCSFPITIINENSFLSRKFYKDFKQPIKEELFQYEKFCQTKDNSAPAKRKERSSTSTNEKAKNGNNFSSYIYIVIRIKTRAYSQRTRSHEIYGFF